MEIKTLGNTPYAMIYNAFTKAFEDYELPTMSPEELNQMLSRRGFDAKLSLGAFVDGKLIAFTFNGIDKWDGKLTAYDTGTGTIKEFRGQGIARKIFNETVPVLKKHGITQYLLEVLQHNEKAVKLYSGVGFEVSRSFDYFVIDIKDIQWGNKKKLDDLKINKIEMPTIDEIKSFWDFDPAWQNSCASIQRTPEEFEIFGAFLNDQLLAYVVSEIKSGDITQLAVRKNDRRKGIATALLHKITTIVPGDSIKLINVDCQIDSVQKFLESLGITVIGKQFEMIKEL